MSATFALLNMTDFLMSKFYTDYMLLNNMYLCRYTIYLDVTIPSLHANQSPKIDQSDVSIHIRSYALKFI